MSASRWGSYRPLVLGIVVGGVIITAVAVMAVRTRAVRQVVATYTELLTAANRQDLSALGKLCSSRYLRTHELTPAEEGGVVGFPRNIHANFQAWREGPHIWLCPTNRTGPVYQFILERGAWRFDGPVGLLRGRNEFIPITEEPLSPPDDNRGVPLPSRMEGRG